MSQRSLSSHFFAEVQTPMLVAYRGARRKLVLAFDVGTIYSRISYRYTPPCHAVNRVFIQVADVVF
jgi:hypothetical protein